MKNKLPNGLCLIGLAAWALSGSAGYADTAVRIAVEHFTVEGDNPLGAEETRTILSQYESQSHDLNGLQSTAKALESAIRAKGHAFYRVILPKQQLGKSHDVALKVVSFPLDEINVEGNRHYERDNILDSLPHLNVGEVPDNETVVNDLKVANYSPGKKLALVFRKMEGSGHLGADLNVRDQDPQSFNFTFNNRGTSSTGRFRLGLAYQHANLFGLDHVLNVNFMASPEDVAGIKQYGVNYMLPIYQTRGWLSGYWSKSDVDVGAIGDFNISGSGEMGGLHYLQFLPQVHGYEHWLDVGWDDKAFTNTVLFGQANVGSNVRSNPFSLTYRGEVGGGAYQAAFNAGWATNITGGADNDTAAYAASRIGAKPQWDVWRYGTNLDFRLYENWVWRQMYSGQYSGQALIPAEQLGLGGMMTVRGYSEREAGGDVANLYKSELWTPQWYPGVNFLAFYDQGHRYLYNAAASGQKSTAWLRSIGVGARWHWQDTVTTSVDLAQALDDSTQTQRYSGKVHAQIMIRF